MLLITCQHHLSRRLLSLQGLQKTQRSDSPAPSHRGLAKQVLNNPARCVTWKLNQWRNPRSRGGPCFTILTLMSRGVQTTPSLLSTENE